ncbi:MAG: hypothetical protein AB1449_08050 [Chloroflexota bacterium]
MSAVTQVRLDPVDLAAPVPALGGTADGPTTETAQAASTPPLVLDEGLPARLRLGARERVSLTVTLQDEDVSGLAEAGLTGLASLHAVGARVGPGAEVALPITNRAPARFEWTVTALGRGPIWLSLSLRLRGVSRQGELLGERLVWARAEAVSTQSWLGLTAPAARWVGSVAALVGLGVGFHYGKEETRWRRRAHRPKRH